METIGTIPRASIFPTIDSMSRRYAPTSRPADASLVPSITTTACGLYFSSSSSSGGMRCLPPASISSLRIPPQAVWERPPSGWSNVARYHPSASSFAPACIHFSAARSDSVRPSPARAHAA